MTAAARAADLRVALARVANALDHLLVTRAGVATAEAAGAVALVEARAALADPDPRADGWNARE